MSFSFFDQSWGSDDTARLCGDVAADIIVGDDIDGNKIFGLTILNNGHVDARVVELGDTIDDDCAMIARIKLSPSDLLAFACAIINTVENIKKNRDKV